jgi:hypothetical protein
MLSYSSVFGTEDFSAKAVALLTKINAMESVTYDPTQSEAVVLLDSEKLESGCRVNFCGAFALAAADFDVEKARYGSSYLNTLKYLGEEYVGEYRAFHRMGAEIGDHKWDLEQTISWFAKFKPIG